MQQALRAVVATLPAMLSSVAVLASTSPSSMCLPDES